MHIALESRALRGAARGIQRYVEVLARDLPKQDGMRVSILEGPPHELLIPWWLSQTIPRRLQALQPDIVHFTKSAVPRGLTIPAVVTIYDVIPLLFPESQKPLQRLYWPRTLRAAAARANHIITISEASKRDIVRHLAVPAQRVTVTPLGINHQQFQPASAEEVSRLQATHQLTRPYVLYVGALEPRKNVPALIRAFAQSAADVPHDLVIAGREYYGSQAVFEEITRQGLTERVHYLGSVPDAALPALYSGADLFVWPSIYEGWGFPPLEAMACGTPVVVSNGGSLPEVVGDSGEVVAFSTDTLAARTADSAFEAALARKITRLLTDEPRRRSLQAAGLSRAALFAWDRVLEQTVAVYQAILADRR